MILHRFWKEEKKFLSGKSQNLKKSFHYEGLPKEWYRPWIRHLRSGLKLYIPLITFFRHFSRPGYPPWIIPSQELVKYLKFNFKIGIFDFWEGGFLFFFRVFYIFRKKHLKNEKPWISNSGQNFVFSRTYVS